MKNIFHIVFSLIFLPFLFSIANAMVSEDVVSSSDSTLVDSVVIDRTFNDSTIIDSALVDTSIVDSTIIDSTSIDSTLVDSTLVDSTLVDSTLVDTTVVDTIVIEEPVIKIPSGFTILPGRDKKLSSYELLKTVYVTFEGIDSLSHCLPEDSLHINASLYNDEEEEIFAVSDSCISFEHNVMAIDFSGLPAEAFYTHTLAESTTVGLLVEGTVICDSCSYAFSIGGEGSEVVWNVRKTYQEIKDFDTSAIILVPQNNSRLESYEDLKTVVLTFNGFEKVGFDALASNDPSLQLYQGKNRIAISYGECEGNHLIFHVPNITKDLVESADASAVFTFTANIDAQLTLDGDVYAFDMTNVSWTVPAVYKMNYSPINTTEAEVLSLSGTKETRNSYSGDIVIPSKVEINGKEYIVTRIGANAFANAYDKITSIQLPNTITDISTSAFESCTGLTKITIPENVKSLGKQAFYNCSGLLEVHSLAESPKIADKTVFQSINSNCSLYFPKEYTDWYNYGGTSDFKKGYWTQYFAHSYQVVVGPSGHTICPACGDVDTYETLKRINVSFDGIDTISAAEGYNLEASLWMNDSIIATANAILYGDKQITFCFDNLTEEMFTLHEEGIVNAISFKAEGKVVIDECYFDLKIGIDENDSVIWKVPMHYIPSVFPLDVNVISYTPESNTLVSSYEELKTVSVSFGTYENLEVDRLGAGYVQATLYKEGTKLMELSTDDVVLKGNQLFLKFDQLDEKDVLVSDNTISSFEFSLSLSAQIILDGTTYSFNSDEDGQNPHWIVPAIQKPVPTDIVVLTDSVVSYNDLRQIALRFEGVDDVTSPNISATLSLDGNEYVTADNIIAEGNVLTLQFTKMSDEDFELISSDSIMRVLRLEVEGEILVKTDEVKNYYSFAFKLDSDSLSWEVPAKLIEEPTVTVVTPLAEKPQIFEDLKQITVALGGFDSLEIMTVNRATLFRHDTQKDVCSIGISSIDVDATTMTLNFSELDKESVAITPEDDATLGVDISLYIEADILLDGKPYHLTVDPSNTDGVTWNLESIVVYKLPTPTLSYSNGRLTMSCGNFQVTYHYEISNIDAVEEANSIVAEKNGNTNTANISLEQKYTIKVYASKENYKDSEVATYNLILYGHTPEITVGTIASEDLETSQRVLVIQ